MFFAKLMLHLVVAAVLIGMAWPPLGAIYFFAAVLYTAKKAGLSR